MKKILLYFSILLGATSMVSCEEDLDIWDSETLEYSGRFVYQLLDENNAVVQDFGAKSGQEIYIYNTAKNQKNEVWIEELGGFMYNMKQKQVLSGDPANFASASTKFEDLELNSSDIQYYIDYTNNNYPASSAGKEDFWEDVCLKFAVEAGSIVKDGATSVGGNTADAFSMKIRLYIGKINIKSYEKAKNLWADPDIPEYEWRYESFERDANLDKVYTLKGYRYTGFPEDAL